MKAKKLFAILCALALLVFSMAGCGKANQADTDAVNTAIDKFCECGSFRLVQTTSMQETVSADGEKFDYNVHSEMEMYMISRPSAQMMTSTLTELSYDGELMDQYTLSYIVPEDGGYAEYIYDGTQWLKVFVEQGDALEGMGARSVAATFFTDGINFGKKGSDSVDGVNAVRYEGKLEGEALLRMLEYNGLLSSISEMSANQQAKIRENLLKDLEAAAVSVCVDESSGYPVMVELDMNGVLNSLDKSIAKTLGNKASDGQWEMSEHLITMKLSDFDAVEEFVLPPDAANATLYEG